MENKDNKIKRGRGRPKVLNDLERKAHKTAYMVNKSWCCDICSGRNYTMAGKTLHLRTKKHIKNILLHQARTHNL